jgi:hypothetical protein
VVPKRKVELNDAASGIASTDWIFMRVASGASVMTTPYKLGDPTVQHPQEVESLFWGRAIAIQRQMRVTHSQ